MHLRDIFAFNVRANDNPRLKRWIGMKIMRPEIGGSTSTPSYHRTQSNAPRKTNMAEVRIHLRNHKR